MHTDDMALSEFEACYFHDEAEEEFYDDSLAKDLFKKFELLTPPQSPPHNPFPPDLETKSVDNCLQEVSQLLDTDLDMDISEEMSTFMDDCCLNLNSKLIQDCMWSGPCLAAAGLITTGSSNPTKKVLVKVTVPKTPNTPEKENSPCGADISSSQCVDPAAVFPYPMSEPPKKVLKPSTNTSYSLGSVAETPSPSESEDDEEIDVVTVVAEKMARKRQSQPSSQTVPVSSSFSTHFAAIHNYSNTQSPPPSFSAPHSPQSTQIHHSHRQSQNHKRSRPVSMPASPQPAKKSRSLLHADLKRVVQKLSNHSSSQNHRTVLSAVNSRNSSDSEDGDINKRAQHNVLERKRRNDLKYSFLLLRDHVPDLVRNERTPKVTILKQAADFVHSVTAKNQALESQLDREKARHEQMKRRLASLRRECF